MVAHNLVKGVGLVIKIQVFPEAGFDWPEGYLVFRFYKGCTDRLAPVRRLQKSEHCLLFKRNQCREVPGRIIGPFSKNPFDRKVFEDPLAVDRELDIEDASNRVPRPEKAIV